MIKLVKLSKEMLNKKLKCSIKQFYTITLKLKKLFKYRPIFPVPYLYF